MRPNAIILHHSLTADSHTVSWRAIRKYHMETLGWKDIGYHFGVERVAGTFEVFLGRQLNEPGAHCKEQGMNGRSIGICFVGNFDEIEVPAGQWDLGLKLVRGLCEACGIQKTQIFGHREFATYKSCPGKFFDVKRFVSNL